MNPNIRERLITQKPRIYHLTFQSAADAWGLQITEGLNYEG